MFTQQWRTRSLVVTVAAVGVVLTATAPVMARELPEPAQRHVTAPKPTHLRRVSPVRLKAGPPETKCTFTYEANAVPC